MAIRVYKPTSPARRFMSVLTFEEVTATKPEKSLLETKKNKAGRNKQGKITVRHQGGGNKQKYRIIDFKRNKDGIPAKVASIEYDPNRTAFIALLHYADGEKRYILAPIDLKVGDTVLSGENADIKPGNCLKLRNIPLGTLIHNIEIVPGRGGQLVRSAGDAAQLMAKEGANAQVRLPSGEVRMISIDPRRPRHRATPPRHAASGKAAHPPWAIRRASAAWLTRAITRTAAGGKSRRLRPCTPWGKPALGLKTRKPKKYSDKKIVKRAGKK